MDNKKGTTMVNYFSVHADKFFLVFFLNVGSGFNVLQFKIKTFFIKFMYYLNTFNTNITFIQLHKIWTDPTYILCLTLIFLVPRHGDDSVFAFPQCMYTYVQLSYNTYRSHTTTTVVAC